MGLRRVSDGWHIGSEGTGRWAQIVSDGSQMSGMVSNGEVSGLGLGFAWSDRLSGIKLEISSEPAWLWESWGLTWNTLKFVYLLIFCQVQRTFDKFLWAAAVTICSAEQHQHLLKIHHLLLQQQTQPHKKLVSLQVVSPNIFPFPLTFSSGSGESWCQYWQYRHQRQYIHNTIQRGVQDTQIHKYMYTVYYTLYTIGAYFSQRRCNNFTNNNNKT